jgi:uncharacterized membrane protein
MEEQRGPGRDRFMERLVSTVLRVGVSLSVLVVLAGGAIYLSRHGSETASYHVFRGEPVEMRSLSGIGGMALEGSGRGLIQLGVLLLILTPVARVAFSAIGFGRERDRLYVLITLIVLAVLIRNLVGGH